MVIFLINNIIRYFIKHPLTTFIFQKIKLFYRFSGIYSGTTNFLSLSCLILVRILNLKKIANFCFKTKFVKLVFPFFYLTQDNAVRKRKVDHFTFQWTHLLHIYDYQPFRTLCSTFSCDESSFNCDFHTTIF